jgi:hypothetical protein
LRNFRYLLLAVLLLGGQFALLAHAIDLKSHSGEGVCEVCLHSAPLDAGLLHAVPVVAPTITIVVSPVELSCAVVTARIPAFAARGPPLFFSA